MENKYVSPKDYNEAGFWVTVRRHAAKWGRAMLVEILTLYYCMVDPATPLKSKTIIAGALAYTVFPADLIPDLLPVVGWSDDAAMIAWAGFEVLKSVSDEHRERAHTKADSLLGRSRGSS
ncbi:MAG: YkvA family protein [Trueperaceae bacterium]